MATNLNVLGSHPRYYPAKFPIGSFIVSEYGKFLNRMKFNKSIAIETTTHQLQPAVIEENTF